MKRPSIMVSSFGVIKKIGLFILLALFLVNLTLAGELWLGLQGGLSLPNIKGGTTELSQGYTSRKAPFFGLAFDYALSPSFSLRTEINYSSQGGQRNGIQPISPDQAAGLPLPPGTTIYANFNNETILDYLEVPLIAELVIGEEIKYFVNGGAYAGYRVRAKTITSGTSLLYLDPSGTMPLDPNLQVSFDAETDVSQEINRWNFGLCGSIGVKVPFGTGLVVLSGRFNYGLSNIQSHPEITGKNHTGALIISLSYFYRLK
ncbi:MAG: PorT family protein [Candidatus Aminicenantes bacterium]|nr:PorT family protein [Candidatus Aminicenantes bacterium]